MLAIVYMRERGTSSEPRAPETVAAPPPAVPPGQVNPWREAARRVEEDRGEPMGRAARVHVPAELRHYADKRRFLAVQVAAWMERDYDIPHDDADLARMIGKGEMVEVPSLGDHYILYGVGANATGEPLSHFDRKTGQEIPLFSRYDLHQDAAAERSAEIAEKKAAAAEASRQAAKLRTKAQARRRRALLAQAKQARQEAAALEKRKARVAAWYDDYDRRRQLVSEWQTLDDLARRLGPRPYDLDEPEDRRAFRGRLLSHLRPAGRDRLLDLAARYDERFGRPLPVTSLVRTEAYQRQLGETNPNATRISVPPHTTGLAYDVYYRYMTGAEQDALMDMVADDERAGRLEALRENRDHIHMMAFAEGRRPPETLIAEAMGVVRPGTRVASRKSTAKTGATARAASRSSRAKVTAAKKPGAARKSPPVRRTGQRKPRR